MSTMLNTIVTSLFREGTHFRFRVTTTVALGALGASCSAVADLGAQVKVAPASIRYKTAAEVRSEPWFALLKTVGQSSADVYNRTKRYNPVVREGGWTYVFPGRYGVTPPNWRSADGPFRRFGVEMVVRDGKIAEVNLEYSLNNSGAMYPDSVLGYTDRPEHYLLEIARYYAGIDDPKAILSRSDIYYPRGYEVVPQAIHPKQQKGRQLLLALRLPSDKVAWIIGHGDLGNGLFESEGKFDPSTATIKTTIAHRPFNWCQYRVVSFGVWDAGELEKRLAKPTDISISEKPMWDRYAGREISGNGFYGPTPIDWVKLDVARYPVSSNIGPSTKTSGKGVRRGVNY